jgi:hypothetical protein
MTDENLVPQVPWPGDREVEDRLHEGIMAALARHDHRTAAELRLEYAHRNMLRRDATLAELVQAVQAGDGHTVADRARQYCAWEGNVRRDVETAREWAARDAAQPEPEAER